MRLRFWTKRGPVEPASEGERASEPAPETPEQQPEPPPPPAPVLEKTPLAARPPGSVSLTIDEAKGVIREAGGDVIQVGFLASAYRRHLEDDPLSAETAASRKRLHELVAKRLKDRGLLAPDGKVELRDGA
jgi:hypothetical protein